MKQCSEDENYDLIYELSIGAEEKNSEICCRCDKIWIDMVLEIDTENKDFQIKFIYPALPSHSFYWKNDFKDMFCAINEYSVHFQMFLRHQVVEFIICPRWINYLGKKIVSKTI